MSDRTYDPDTREWLIRRRDFLILGSTAAVGAVATTAAAEWTRPSIPIAAMQPLSLGFVDAGFDDLGTLDQPRAVKNAAQLGARNHLRDSVRVNVYGIVRASGDRRQSSVTLDAIYRTEPHGDVPFLAWSDHDAARRGTSSKVGFVIPAAASTPVTLALTTRPAPSVTAALTRRFLGTTDEWLRGSATLLRRGVYFIAVQATPAWDKLHLVPGTGKLPQLMQSGILGTRPVEFDYIVVGTEQA